MIFRELFEEKIGIKGYVDAEKDPEEFLTLLIDKALKAEPLLELKYFPLKFLKIINRNQFYWIISEMVQQTLIQL